MSELFNIIFRTILILIIMFLITKLIGKKQISQMNIYDYIIGITMGSIAADISLDIEKSIVSGVVSLLIYGISSVIVTLLSLKNMKLRKFINGTPTILINNGNIIFNNLKKEGIDINDLEEEARQNGYFDLSKINYAILEISGKISFLAKSKYESIVKEDMNIKTSNEELKVNIIIDGVLLEENLVAINKDIKWLEKKLEKKGYKNYQDILLLTLDIDGNITIFDKNIDSPLVIV